MTDHVRGIVDSIKWLLKRRNEKNEPLSSNILITAQSLFDLTDEFERTEREKDAAQAELVQIKLKHGDEEGIVPTVYLFQKAEQEARAYMRRQQEAAAPKWIDMTLCPPKKDEIGFAYAPEEGLIQLIKVIEATPYKLDVEAIYPKHGIPCIGRYWMPLRFPEPPEEEACRNSK